jgi:hypothetical protein
MPGVIQRGARTVVIAQRPFRAWSWLRSHTAGARHARPLRVRAPLRGRSARFIRGCLLRSLKAISYFQAITRTHDARAFLEAAKRAQATRSWRSSRCAEGSL